MGKPCPHCPLPLLLRRIDVVGGEGGSYSHAKKPRLRPHREGGGRGGRTVQTEETPVVLQERQKPRSVEVVLGPRAER